LYLHEIRILYLRELRAALRERGIVIGSVLVPLLLYPVLLWLLFTAMTFVRGQEERFTSRIAVAGLPAEHAELREKLEGMERVELVAAPEEGARESAVAAGELDGVLEILPPPAEGAALPANFRAEVVYDASKERSERARARLTSALDEYRRGWLEREAAALGVGDERWRQFRVERRNVATGGEMGAFVLGLLAPLLMIFMMAVGCFYPAVDATAGEHERKTWETLMTTAASRTGVVVAKYLYVATMGCVAGLLNLLAMTVSMRAILAPMLGERSGEMSFRIPLAALPVVAVAAVLLAMFIAAGMMIFAAFARTFKEGQSMVGPFYLICLMPALFVQSPDLELDAMTALIPIANVALLFRAAIAGVFDWPLIGLTLAVEVAAVVACLALARYLLGFEDVLTGSYDGNLGRLLKNRLLRRGGPPATEAGR